MIFRITPPGPQGQELWSPAMSPRLRQIIAYPREDYKMQKFWIVVRATSGSSVSRSNSMFAREVEAREFATERAQQDNVPYIVMVSYAHVAVAPKPVEVKYYD